MNNERRAENHLRTFLKILEAYPGDVPLAKFLPDYYRKNKQMGSTDRRMATNLLYTYFRLGRACAHLPEQERLIIAEFLSGSTVNEFLSRFKPGLNSSIHLSLDEKIDLLKDEGIAFNLSEVFPFSDHFSEGINAGKFIASIFIQPDLFIRPHPGKETNIKRELHSAQVSFTEEPGGALRLANGTKLDALFPGKRHFEVQDLSSQHTGTYFHPQKYDKWWDACAASGGKSLLLLAQQPEIKLVVSDIRESVLSNLDERFRNAGITNYQKKEIDLLQNPDPILHDYAFDGIIADVPCTGSGTWGRSPEMISQFNERTIRSFQHLQKAILKNVIPFLKPGKPLIYITCSVFREENEEMVAHLVKEYGMTSESATVLKGYEQRADTMFVARLRRE